MCLVACPRPASRGQKEPLSSRLVHRAVQKLPALVWGAGGAWPILTYWNTFISYLLDEFLTLTSVRESVDADISPILHIQNWRPEFEAFCWSRSRLPTLCILGVSFWAHHLTSLGQIFSSLKWNTNTVLYRVVQGIWCTRPPKTPIKYYLLTLLSSLFFVLRLAQKHTT